MKGKLNNRSLAIIARGMAKQHDITIRMGASCTCTDGKTIFLTSLPDEDKASLTLGRGYIDHESAHCKFTDFSVLNPTDGLTNNFFQALEDGRIETLQSEAFPGSRVNLANMVCYLTGLDDVPNLFAPMASENGREHIVSAFVVQKTRGWFLDQEPLKEYLETTRSVLKQVIGADLADQIESVVESLIGARTTSDVFVMAQRITDLFRSADDDADQGADDNPENERSDNPEQDSGGDEAPSNEGTLPPSDLGEILQRKIDRVEDDGTSVDTTFTSPSSEGEIDSTVQPVSKINNRCDVRRLRSSLQNVLLAPTRVQTKHSQSGSKLDRNRLATVGIPGSKPFRKQRRVIGTDTSVQLLLDRSGSMLGSEKLAGQCVYILMETLEQMRGVKSSCAAFPGVGRHISPVTVLTDFFESLSATSDRYVPMPSGGTPMADAVWQGGISVLSQSSARRVMLVITDGEASVIESARLAVENIERRGVECYAIGIKSDVSAVFGVEKSINIASIDDLANGITKFARILSNVA